MAAVLNGPQENWSALELLPKLGVRTDLFTHIKTAVCEELFDSFYIYYGDDPSRYNISFEAILGTYCNKMEWVSFLSTALACAAHAIRFDDLDKLTMGKMLFYIQVPRVATGAGVPTSRQTTIMVTKYTDKSAITIPFELSAACLTHLREAFEATLLDRLLNVDALNTVLRVVKNSADAMERGLVNNFLETLLRRAPPYFIVRTLLENSTINRQTLTRVQRANILVSFKAKLIDTIFLLNRTRDRGALTRFFSQFLESVTESILDNPETYVTANGTRISGVIVSTAAVMQVLVNILGTAITRESVRTPASYGRFVLSKENAVTALQHHAIMADFTSHAARVAQSNQGPLDENEFLDQETPYAQLPFDVLQVGERAVLIEHLRRVYKNTDAKDPLERDIELTFFFPLGLFLPPERGYTTVDAKLRLADTAVNDLPTAIYFYDKNRQHRYLTYADCLRTLCHPTFQDAALCFQIFQDGGPPEDERAHRRLCRREFPRDGPANVTRRLLHFYQARLERPRTANEIKHDYTPSDFYKPETDVLYTELHPAFDFTHHADGARTRALCTPRILVGNLPEPLAPGEFHEARARQLLESSKLKLPPGCEAALAAMHVALTDTQYPELCYLLDALTHGHPDALAAARPLLARCAQNYYNQRQGLAFSHSYDLLLFVATGLSDNAIAPPLQQLYRQALAALRFLQRVSATTGMTGQIGDEPLTAYLNALHDPRLLPPLVTALPRHLAFVQLVADELPLGNALLVPREPHLSNVTRLSNADRPEPFYVDARRLSGEEAVAQKIFQLCLLPALTNNRMCGCGLRLKELIVQFFYDPAFMTPPADDGAAGAAGAAAAAAPPSGSAAPAAPAAPGAPPEPRNRVLLALLEGIATDAQHTAAQAAQELFALVPYVPEHPKILEVRASLDPAQRHGVATGFVSLQHALYNGFCITTPLRLLAPFAEVVPFHRFYADPTLAAALSNDVRLYLQDFPHLHRHDGAFPLAPLFAQEYHQWHRTSFSRYSANCPNTVWSALTLVAMHHKFSPVATALLSRLRVHPGYALTAVRTDVFETDTLMYGSKSCSALVINNPKVEKEERDLVTTYHVSQNISTVDMGMGYSSAVCTAHLRRVRTDMGARVQDLFRIFPMHVHRDDDVDHWLRQVTGAERTELLDADAISMLTFGGVTDRGGSYLLHGQQTTVELVATPVTADINFFRHPNNPRGRSSCLIGADPHDEQCARRALYNHREADPQTFQAATQNPWASQPGSLGDVLYNTKHRDHLGSNASFYSPCAQYFTESDIVATNKTLFKTIDDYLVRAQDVVRSDLDLQYICVDGTQEFIEQPCRFLQEALPIMAASTPAMLEAQSKNFLRPDGIHETHFGNYIIRETIPLHQSILFNS